MILADVIDTLETWAVPVGALLGGLVGCWLMQRSIRKKNESHRDDKNPRD